ncbi:MAG: PEGA domain-containing protein [Methanoregula sp.]
MTWLSYIRKSGLVLAIIMVFALTYTVSAVSAANSVIVMVKDTRTKQPLDDAQVYFDGGYRGTTSSDDGAGTLVIRDVSDGTHTVRVTRPGFKEITKKIAFPAESAVEVSISQGSLVSLNPDGPAPNAINIIFYPSSTSYNCKDHAKVSTSLYMTNETRFREDAMNLIDKSFMSLDQFTSSSNPLPENYRDHFNFYYYYDPSAPADAFSGCAGTVPESYWNDVTFSDVTVILYPQYYGIYADSTCQPTGCFQNFGPGRSVMKAPADQVMLFKHESGHAVFELIDTYCGSTYYYQNDPHANVWASEESCRTEAQSNNRDPDQCRQIQKKSSGSTSCIKDFWQWDPMPDIMANGYGGKFGAASTQRINSVLSQSGAE